MGDWWNDSDGGNGSNLRRTCPSAILSTINAAWDRSQDFAVRDRRLTSAVTQSTVRYPIFCTLAVSYRLIFRVEKYFFNTLMEAAHFHTKRRKISVRPRGRTFHMMLIHT